MSGSITVRRQSDTAFVSGALPQPDGSFKVDGLPVGRYVVRFRGLGFAPLVRPIQVTAQQPVIDLGTLEVAGVVTQLQGQQIVAERDEVSLAPDRNSYSTKNMTTASGGTAIDVLRNVPSVEVDGSNQVSLRSNGNVVVQINGRSSPLKGEQLGSFLAQLPAGTVKSVEVATNPSAKNDPEGTAGIINIVLNQEAELGLSGGVSAGAGTTGMANVSGNIGRQAGPLTLFLSGSYRYDNRATTGLTSRTNFIVPEPVYVESNSSGASSPTSMGLTFRSEYRFTKRDALSLDAMSYSGRSNGSDVSFYTDYDAERSIVGLYDQFNDSRSHNQSQDYALAFRRTGGPLATTFSSELRYSLNDNSSNADLYGLLHQADASTSFLDRPREHDYNTGRYPSWNLQADFTHPFGTHTKLETGLKGTDRHTVSDFTAAYLDSATGVFMPVEARTTAYDYLEQIGAAYAVLSQQVGKVQAQGGLRLEQAATRFDLPNTAQHYDNHYASAFPSAILSYNLTDTRQAKVSYSRRVSRPNPYQLSPIEQRGSTRNIFRGNPALQPEYTNAFELGLQEARSWGAIQINPYLRRTANAVRYIQTTDTTGVTLSTFDNVASTTTIGSDLNVSVRGGPLTLFTGGSAYRYSSDASNLATNLSTTAFVWSVRANATWKFSDLADAQLFANYRAPTATEGGRQDAFVFMNIGARYKLWGDKGNIALRLSDPFNLMKFGYRTENLSALELSQRHFGQRGLVLTITRNFGQQLKLRPRPNEADPNAQATPGVPTP